jgi:hypothetical protein
MGPKQETLVKFALATYRHEIGVRGPVGGGSGFATLSAHETAEVREVVRSRVATDIDKLRLRRQPDSARPSTDEPYYQVERSMLDRLSEAWTRGRSDRAGSFDVRISFRRPDDGDEWSEVAFIDRDSGQLIVGDGQNLVLDSPDALDWMLDRIAEEGWRMRREQEGE